MWGRMWGQSGPDLAAYGAQFALILGNLRGQFVATLISNAIVKALTEQLKRTIVRQSCGFLFAQTGADLAHIYHAGLANADQ